MTKRQTDAKGGDAGEVAGGEVTHRTRLEYVTTYYRDGRALDAPPDASDAHIETALAALTHLELLFQLLSLADSESVRREAQEHPASFAMMLEHLGDFGGSLVSVAYSGVEEARRAA